MELAGESGTVATDALVQRTLRPGDGGAIALSRSGDVAMSDSTGGMFRGRCGPNGEIDVRIWEDAEALPPAE